MATNELSNRVTIYKHRYLEQLIEYIAIMMEEISVTIWDRIDAWVVLELVLLWVSSYSYVHGYNMLQ